LIPNGVDSKWIDSSVPAVPRELLAESPRRRILGFVGAVVADWVDVGLLARTAKALPEAQVAVVGPVRTACSLKELRNAANVRFLGPKPHGEVPAWIKAMDVCLIPFHRNELAQAADPIKLYEYCALGKPVVSTVQQDLPADLAPVRVAGSDEEFIEGVKSALSEGDPARRTERIAFASRHTWERRASDLLAAVDLALERKAPGGRV
jgi:glycosyltransferase involved in cell wall biosynthesis